MRHEKRLGFWLVTILASLVVLGGGSADEITMDDGKKGDDGINLYFRNGDLSSVTDQELPKYPDDAAGESKRLGRDFPDAPPQIAHEVEDMYPITAEDNECLECHHPENAISKDDLPLPESHFQAPVMGKGAPGDPMIWVVKDYKKIKDVLGARYNCNMCHTPQAMNVRILENDFVSPKK